MHRLPPEQFNQHKTCFKALFHLLSHLFITFPSGNVNIHSQHQIATFHSTNFEQKIIVWKKSSTLLDQNLGPCVDCTRGRGLLIIVPVRCENWADLGKFWGNGQMPNICRGRNASFGVNVKRAGQIFLQMDLFGWHTKAHLVKANPVGRKTCNLCFTQNCARHNMALGWGLKWRGFSRCSETFARRELWKMQGFSGDPDWHPPPTHAKVTDYWLDESSWSQCFLAPARSCSQHWVLV